jgi:excisionase family DNA binding protein
MTDLVGPEERHSGRQEGRSTLESPLSFPATSGERTLSGAPYGIELLLTTKEASQVLKIHPKVLERMAKRGEVPALKVGKFWRYRATALDAWINSRLQFNRQPCRMKTSF